MKHPTTMMNEFPLLETLARHGVPFVIIGGHAVNFHGSLRATEDVDVVWLRSASSERSLKAALDELGAEYISNQIDPSTGIEKTYRVTIDYIRNRRLMMLCTRHGFLDLFDFVPDHPDTPVIELLNTSIDVDGLRFVSLAWLRRLKRAANRPKDQIDLRNLPDTDEDAGGAR
jgi:hypothetical protein